MSRNCLLLLSLFLAGTAWALGTPGNWRDAAAHNDVVYRAPARAGWEGLPLGNGTLGAQAWQPEQGLAFQLNTPLSGVYGGALAQVRLNVLPVLTAGLSSYRQRLSLREATLYTDIATSSGAIHAIACIPADEDVLVVHFADTRADAQERVIELLDWHPTAVLQAAGDRLLITDALKGGANEPDYRYALAAAVDDAPVTAEMDQRTLRLRVAAHTFTLWVAVAATRDPRADVGALAATKLAAAQARGLKALRTANAAWWAQFWQHSSLTLSSADGVADYLANLWYLHIYAMGAGARGEVPPKFNGGLWTTIKTHASGAPATGTGIRRKPVGRSTRPTTVELLTPYYRMYGRMRANVERQTKEYFGVDGAQFEERSPTTAGMPAVKGRKSWGCIHACRCRHSSTTAI